LNNVDVCTLNNKSRNVVVDQLHIDPLGPDDKTKDDHNDEKKKNLAQSSSNRFKNKTSMLEHDQHRDDKTVTTAASMYLFIKDQQ
jgi:hypothetical protein